MMQTLRRNHAEFLHPEPVPPSTLPIHLDQHPFLGQFLASFLGDSAVHCRLVVRWNGDGSGACYPSPLPLSWIDCLSTVHAGQGSCDL